MANPKTPGDLFFENYCDLNGYLYWYEPGSHLLGIDVPTRPDYLVERGGDRAIVEVKHFTTTRQLEKLMATPGQAMYFETYSKLQTAVREGGEQLAPYASLNLPLIVALTNPLTTDVDFYPDDMVTALLGKTSDVFDLERPGLHHSIYSGEEAAVYHRDATGATINRLPHLAAVVALYGLEAFPRADVYDLSGAIGFAGTPLRRRMFDADDDTRLGFLEPERFGRLPDV